MSSYDLFPFQVKVICFFFYFILGCTKKREQKKWREDKKTDFYIEIAVATRTYFQKLRTKQQLVNEEIECWHCVKPQNTAAVEGGGKKAS